MTGTDNRQLRVLLVEDSPDDAELLMMELRRAGYQLDLLRVQTADEMGAALRERTWDIVISDHSLPSFSAPAAFALLRQTGLDIPFIIVSGTVGEDVAVEAMRTGVHDYLLKGNLRRLVGAIDRELREAAIRAEQRKIREQLLISDRMASVGTLAAGVAHEINNPLSVVIGNLDHFTTMVLRMAELLQAQPAESRGVVSGPLAELSRLVAEMREPLADTQEAAERVRVIVRDLRLLSRAEEEVTGPVDVRKVLDSSLRMARNEIRHRAQIVREYRDIPLVHANESRLGQVFLNLLVNAAQAVPEGKINDHTIKLVARRTETQVLVEIADTGAGIPPDVLPRIFDVFFTTKPIGVGTGLGLAICHRLVSAMGGTITVDSRVGAGTTFRVALPIARRGTPMHVPIVSAGAGAPRRRGAVLIVEDEQAVGRTLQRLLTSSHDATLVTSGRDALARVDAGEQYDVILCDLMMPEMTGMELYASLAARSPNLARRVVFMSGGAFTPSSREFLDRVENRRIDKPVDGVRLKQVIEDVLDSARAS